MKTTECRIFVGLFCSILVFSLVIPSWTELHAGISEYPNRPISMILPYAPGGPTDLSGRALAEAMEKHLKQPVVVVNKPGGAGTIGGYAVVSAKPDGYTLLYSNQATSLPEVFSYFYDSPYTSKDLRPISRILITIVAITVKGDAPWNSLKDLVESAKKLGGMKMATSGKNTTGYMFARILERKEKAGFTAVPMNSDADIITALLGGHVPVGNLVNTMTVKGLADAKKVKILTFLAKRRTDFSPNIPTVVELGYDLTPVGFLGFFGPQKMPDEAVEKIDGVVRKVVQEPDFKAKIKGMGLVMDYGDPSDFERFIGEAIKDYQSFYREEGLVKK